MELKALCAGEDIPLRPGARPVIEEVGIAALHKFSGPKVSSLDARLLAARKTNPLGDFWLVIPDPLVEESGVILRFPVLIKGKGDSISRNAMSRKVRQLYDGLEEAVIVRHIGKILQHIRYDCTAARQVNDMSVPNQAALSHYSREVAVKAVPIMLRHPAKVSMP